jgi:hypothetical protein
MAMAMAMAMAVQRDTHVYIRRTQKQNREEAKEGEENSLSL